MRHVSNIRTGFPHQLGHISNRAATVAEVLQREGYATFCLGKWHLAPTRNLSAAGPFDQWPLGRGFDRYYGFLEGETDQFHPEIVIDNHVATTPGSPGGRLPLQRGHGRSDAADDQRQQGRPSRSPVLRVRGRSVRTHAPHQAPSAYLREVSGSLRRGLGRHPAAMVRAPTRTRRRSPTGPSSRRAIRVSTRGTTCPRTSSGSQRRSRKRSLRSSTTPTTRSGASSRAFAGSVNSTTRSSSCSADNGASQEGGPFGVMNEMKFFNGILDDPDDVVDRLDDIGGPDSHTNYPWGWAQCGNSPFKWYKQNTHEGGVHVPMVDALAGRHRCRPGGHQARPVRQRVRHRADDLRPARRRRRPTCITTCRQLPITGELVRRRSSPTPMRRQRPPCSTSSIRDRVRSWRSRTAPGGRPWSVTNRATTSTPSSGSCTTSASTLGMHRPRERAAGQARRVDRAVVVGGRAPWSAAARRSRARAVRPGP